MIRDEVAEHTCRAEAEQGSRGTLCNASGTRYYEEMVRHAEAFWNRSFGDDAAVGMRIVPTSLSPPCLTTPPVNLL